MSIADEISRLQGAKADLKTAIEGKGVTVPSTTKLDGYAALVDDIETDKWVRPASWPNLDAIDVTGFSGGYFTYDLSKATDESCRFVSIYAQASPYKQCTIERGHLDSNNRFVADESFTTVSYKFQRTLDPANGQIQLWRAYNPDFPCMSAKLDNWDNITNSASTQPCVETLLVGDSETPITLHTALTGIHVENVTVKGYVSGGYNCCVRTPNMKKFTIDADGGELNDVRSFLAGNALREFYISDNVTLENPVMGNFLDSCQSLEKFTYPAYTTTSTNPMIGNGCSNLIELDMRQLGVASVNNMQNFLNGCNRLRVLNMDGLDFTGVTTGTVTVTAYSLEELYPAKFYTNQKWNCDALSVASLRRLLNVLPTVAETKTLKIGEFNLSKLTAEEVAIATGKGWTVS